MGEIIGGWNKPQVAMAQHDLVIKELSVDSLTIGPYAAFRWAMDTIGMSAWRLGSFFRLRIVA